MVAVCGNSRMSAVEAKRVHAAFVAICGSESYVGLTVEKIIRAAKNPRSPLHKHFTWNLEKAATPRWRDEARQLVASVRFKITLRGEEFTPRFAHSVRMKVERSSGAVVRVRTYASTPELRKKQNADLRRQVVADYVARLREWVNATAAFDELAPLRHMIQRALKK